MITILFTAIHKSGHAIEETSKKYVYSATIDLADRRNRVQVEIDAHVCGWRYEGRAKLNIFASEKHVHVFVTNHPRYVSNTFTEAVMLNGAVGERATRHVRADFTHVRHEGATCVERTEFLALV